MENKKGEPAQGEPRREGNPSSKAASERILAKRELEPTPGHPEGGEAPPEEAFQQLTDLDIRMNKLSGAGAVEGVSAEQFYMYKWRDEHANQVIDWPLMREFAEAYAALKVREATRGKCLLPRQFCQDLRNAVAGTDPNITSDAALLAQPAKLREERDALKHELGLALRELAERGIR